MFNLAIDGKLRGCDVVAMRVEDVAAGAAPSYVGGPFERRYLANRSDRTAPDVDSSASDDLLEFVNLQLANLVSASGVEADKVAVAQFGPDQIEELARDPTLDAFMAVGPLDSKITSDAIAATAQARGEPKFLAIE
jgi:hypothetical protein